jgi:hypothetical protein
MTLEAAGAQAFQRCRLDRCPELVGVKTDLAVEDTVRRWDWLATKVKRAVTIEAVGEITQMGLDAGRAAARVCVNDRIAQGESRSRWFARTEPLFRCS